ncbi:MAG: hypothetical protein U0166_23770 [Acidobacteriota bacterium]
MNVLRAVLLLAAPVLAQPRTVISFALPEAPEPSQDTLAAASEILDRLAGLPRGTVVGRGVGSVADAREAIRGAPAVAFLSLPLYLEAAASDRRPRILRTPRRGGQTFERYEVVVRAGSPIASVSDLAGKSLTGSLLWDDRFVKNVVLDSPGLSVELRPVRRPLDAVKAVKEGRADAMLLTGAESMALEGLVGKGELRSVFVSAPLPLPPIVGFSAAAAPGEAALVEALGKLCADPDGALLCEAFAIEGFAATESAAYEEALRRYERTPAAP